MEPDYSPETCTEACNECEECSGACEQLGWETKECEECWRACDHCEDCEIQLGDPLDDWEEEDEWDDYEEEW